MIMTTQKNYITTEHRYLSALHDIQQSGVLVFDNYPSCCGSCTYAEIDSKHPGTDHISFFNQQGRGIKFVNGVPFNFELDYEYNTDLNDYTDEVEVTRRATDLYWSHSTLKAAKATRDAFMRHGFTVDWDGTDARCVVVKFPV